MTQTEQARILANRGGPLEITLKPGPKGVTEITVAGAGHTTRRNLGQDLEETERHVLAMLAVSRAQIMLNGRTVETQPWDGTPWCGLIRRGDSGTVIRGPKQPGPETAGARESMGLMIGGTLHEGPSHTAEGRVYMTAAPDHGAPWDYTWLCHVLPYTVITTGEFDEMAEDERTALFAGTVPDRLKARVKARAKAQMEKADEKGCLPTPATDPVWQMALAWDQTGLPYGQPAHITTKATPATLREAGPGGENPEPDLFASAAHALYQAPEGPVPVDHRWSHPPEAIKNVSPLRNIKFTVTGETGTSPLKRADEIILTFELDGETVDVNAPLLIRGQTKDDVEMVLTRDGSIDSGIEVALRTLHESYDGIPAHIADDEIEALRTALTERFGGDGRK